MSGPRHADRAARFLHRHRRADGAPGSSDPAQSIARLGQAIGAAHRRHRIRLWLRVGATCAGALAITFGVHAWRRSAPATVRAPFERPPVQSVAQRDSPAPSVWPAGSQLRATVTPLVLTDADGTTVSLAPGSAAAVLRSDHVRWLALERGKLEARVAKLAPGRRFVVATADREVEVRGTRFTVEVVPPIACAGGATTQVAVDEGIVEVRRPGGAGEKVPAGARWPAPCESAARPPRAKSQPAKRPPETTSTLESENDLLARAIRADRAGDRTAALADLDRLLELYPSSPLRQAAAAERERLKGPVPAH